MLKLQRDQFIRYSRKVEHTIADSVRSVCNDKVKLEVKKKVVAWNDVLEVKVKIVKKIYENL